MKATPKQPSSEEMAQFRAQLSRKIERLVGESLETWAECENSSCRRAKRCVSEKRECIARWQATLPPLSPEQAAQRLADFKRELELRSAGFPLDEPAKAKAARGNKTVATPAKCPAPGDSDREALAPLAGETPPLSPQQQARIDRPCNDIAASQPAEPDKARERRPRITLL
jgi:hypothetical protein